MQELSRLLRAAKKEKRKLTRPQRRTEQRKKRKIIKKKPPPVLVPKRITRGDVARAMMSMDKIPSNVHETILNIHGVIKCFSCNEVKPKGKFHTNHRTCKVCCSKKGTTLYSFADKLVRDCGKRTDHFDISVEWVCSRFHELGGKCELCDEEMTHVKGIGGDEKKFNKYPLNLSLDQIVEGKGYLKTNIQLTHLKCNLMKLDMGMEEFLRTCSLIHKKYNNI